ncbi:hypothetical protein ACFY7V_03395 [[Kitasatospora] papulosa]|uniref:hypothetical protein n=1 Tax=Streptomyces TaxID=1883 RepID=UPI002FEFDB0A
MTHDYVAILTGLNGLVLVGASVQGALRYRQYVTSGLADLASQWLRIEQLMDARRRGEEPSADDLLIIRRAMPRWRNAHRFVAKYSLTAMSGSAYIVLFLFVLKSQMDILKWAGTADASADPDLAHRSFVVTMLSLAALLLDGLVAGTAALIRGVRQVQGRMTAEYTPLEQREALAVIQGRTPTSATTTADSNPSPQP